MQDRNPGLAQRHPVVAFWLGLVPLSACLELAWAEMAGGFATWGGDIVWYRLSSLANDLVLAAGAYAVARVTGGRLWWREQRVGPWLTFWAICWSGALLMLVLARRLVALYPDPRPPMATGWLDVWQRTWLPFFLLVWLRRHGPSRRARR